MWSAIPYGRRTGLGSRRAKKKSLTQARQAIRRLSPNHETTVQPETLERICTARSAKNGCRIELERLRYAGLRPAHPAVTISYAE
jgi:hypothetical protein